MSRITRFTGDYEINATDLMGNLDVTVHTMTVNGNLNVEGEINSITFNNSSIKDNFITLNAGETNSGVTAGTAGINIDRGTAANVALRWNENSPYGPSQWELTNNGTTWNKISTVEIPTNVQSNLVWNEQPSWTNDLQWSTNAVWGQDSGILWNNAPGITWSGTMLPTWLGNPDMQWDTAPPNIAWGPVSWNGYTEIIWERVNTPYPLIDDIIPTLGGNLDTRNHTIFSSNSEVVVFGTCATDMATQGMWGSGIAIANTNVTPAVLTDHAVIYTQPPSVGGTGIFVHNVTQEYATPNVEVTDELISKTKAIAFSLIF